MEMNSVDYILRTSLSDIEKILIKNQGPPRPDLTIVKQDKRKDIYFARKFNKTMYKSANWLCGCDVRNAFFCFVCIVVDVPGRSDVPWTRQGVTDLKHISEKVKVHKQSIQHLHSEIDFAMLGRTNAQMQLDSSYRRSIKDHNEKVTRNRYILNKIIDCIKFCGAFEVALQGHKARDNSTNPGVFKGLINLLAETDNNLKDYLSSSSAFGSPETIQNEVLDAMLRVCRDIIKTEIKNADFLALQVDEAIDFSNKRQTILIFRYVLDGQVFERFWGFFTPEEYTADGLSTLILEQCEILDLHETPQRLISQSYDGASALRDRVGCVPTKIKNIYREAHFIHCHAHKLHLIVEKAASQNKKVRIFFANLEGFFAYFSRSADRTMVLNDFMKTRIPRMFSDRWSFDNATISNVCTYRESLIEYFDEIIDKEMDNATLREITGLQKMLQDSDFIFWLNFFTKIMLHVDILQEQLQRQQIDSSKVNACISDFKESMQAIRAEIDMTYDVKYDIMPTSPLKLKMIDNVYMIAKEICDVIVMCVEDRFRFLDHLTLALLLCPDKFTQYSLTFPQDTYTTAMKVYPFLDSIKLKQELRVLYNREDFSTFTSALALLQLFLDNSLCEAFSEITKLLKIVCTIPMTAVENECNFSTLKEIRTFLTNNTVCDDKFTSLAMCSVEKKLIENTKDFNSRVIDYFAQQNHRQAEFVHKSYN